MRTACSRPPPRLVAAGGLLLLCAVAAADDPKDATRRHADRETKASLALPADWAVEVEKATKLPRRILRLSVRPPEVTGRFHVTVFRLLGLAEPLPQAYHELVSVAKRERATQSWVERKPMPHAVFERERKGVKGRLVHIYRHIRGNGCTLVVECPATMWDDIADAMFAAVATLEIAAPRWPATPAGYEQVEKDGYTYLLHPAVDQKDVDAYHRHLRIRERAFQRRFGAFEVSAKNPATVVFHRVAEDAAPISETAAAVPGGHYCVIGGRRVYAVPLKPGRGAFSNCDYTLFDLFFWLRYGCSEPRWLLEGESTLLWAADGERLPVGSKWILAQPALPPPFTELDALLEKDYQLGRKTAALYLGLFHAGPRVYREAFDRYLKARETEPDWRRAAADHLHGLDQADLRAAAARFLAEDLVAAEAK